MAPDGKNLRDIVDQARACVHRGEARQALGLLDSVQPDIDDSVGTSVWVEHKLVYAGALAATSDPDAEVAFVEALKRVSMLAEPDPTLEMLVHKDFGKYLAEQRAFDRAREHYRMAEKIAESLDRPDEVARFQMCVISVDLQQSRESGLGAFQRLKEAAKEGYTYLEQREAWIDYAETRQRHGRELVAARKGGEPSVDYFRGVLSEIRRRRG